MAVSLFGIAVIGLQVVGKPIISTWLRAHSVARSIERGPGDRYYVSIHRYPRLYDIPEILGFGQGFVQLYDPATGRVLQDKAVEDLAAINQFAWSRSSVRIGGFADWKLPTESAP